jgi:2-isopropylmalate synthase
MRSEHHLELPRRLQIEFSRVVQGLTEGEAGEISAEQIWDTFAAEYLDTEEPFALESVQSSASGDSHDELLVDLRVRGEVGSYKGEGNGPVAAFVDAVRGAGAVVRVLDYAEHALSSGGDALAAAYVECEIGEEIVWGVGIHPNIVTASLRAVLSAANRAAR